MLDVFTSSEFLSTYPSLEGRRDWPEGAIYRHDRTGHELLRVVRGVDEPLVAGVTTGPVDLALVIEGPLLVVCSRVKSVLPWAGASFHWHRVGRSERILPPTGADTVAGSRLDLLLMEALGGRVRVIRSLVLPLDFTRALHEAVLEQARFTYDPGAERRALETLLRRCPTPNALAVHATIKATLPAA